MDANQNGAYFFCMVTPSFKYDNLNSKKNIIFSIGTVEGEDGSERS